MTHPHDRAFYRLPYPPRAAPHFVSGGVTHRVVDIGEGGFRYAPAAEPIPLAGETVKGVLEFPEDDPLEVEGTVVRLQGGEVAVHCAARPIPLALVLREQRRLRRRFPFRG
jgi:hypothetical protein